MSIDRTQCPATGPHGTSSAASNRGCTCPDAREARRLADKRRAHGLQPPGNVPALGTARRLQALAALGWAGADLADRLGCTRQHITWLRNEPGRRVSRRNAVRVARLYAQLCGTPGPSRRSRMLAGQAGWAPPAAWDGINIDDPAARPVFDAPATGLPDEVHIRRVTTGHAPIGSLPSRADRIQVVTHLAGKGWAHDRIAAWVGTTERTVERYLADTRRPRAARTTRPARNRPAA